METKTVHYRHNPQIDKARYHGWVGLRDGTSASFWDNLPVVMSSTLICSQATLAVRRQCCTMSTAMITRPLQISGTGVALSQQRYYQTTGNVSNIIFYHATGDIAARASFVWQHLEGKPNTEWPLVQTSLEVLDYDGEHLWFESEMHAWEYFVQHEQQKRSVALITKQLRHLTVTVRCFLISTCDKLYHLLLLVNEI